eukprot:363563-Chlamydomonas_euryale.AAC.7
MPRDTMCLQAVAGIRPGALTAVDIALFTMLNMAKECANPGMPHPCRSSLGSLHNAPADAGLVYIPHMLTTLFSFRTQLAHCPLLLVSPLAFTRPALSSHCQSAAIQGCTNACLIQKAASQPVDKRRCGAKRCLATARLFFSTMLALRLAVPLLSGVSRPASIRQQPSL